MRLTRIALNKRPCDDQDLDFDRFNTKYTVLTALRYAIYLFILDPGVKIMVIN